MDLNLVLQIFAALVGFPAFLAAAINLAKYFGWLDDGSAPVVVFWANIVAFVGVAVAVFYVKLDVLAAIDNALGVVGVILVDILAMLTSMGLTKLFHAGLRGIPVIGYSHSIAEFGEIRQPSGKLIE